MGFREVDLYKFWEDGLLFEINRRVLHPLGMAVRFNVDMEARMATFESIQQTDDPEGIIMDPDTFVEASHRYRKYLKWRKLDLDVRKERLGFLEQVEP